LRAAYGILYKLGRVYVIVAERSSYYFAMQLAAFNSNQLGELAQRLGNVGDYIGVLWW